MIFIVILKTSCIPNHFPFLFLCGAAQFWMLILAPFLRRYFLDFNSLFSSKLENIIFEKSPIVIKFYKSERLRSKNVQIFMVRYKNHKSCCVFKIILFLITANQFQRKDNNGLLCFLVTRYIDVVKMASKRAL